MKIWIDDERPAPEGWIWVKTFEEFHELLLSAEIEEVSFDFYLGIDDNCYDRRTGLDCARIVCDMARRKQIKRFAWQVHSTHPYAPQIVDMLTLADRHWNRNENVTL